VKKLVGSCDVCAPTKNLHHHLHASTTTNLGIVMPLIPMVLITYLLALSNSYNSILVAVDLLTKIVHIIFFAKIITNEKIFKLFFGDVF
jgi:hypothetical protein